VAQQTVSQAGYPLNTLCHKQLRFESLCSKEIIADFAGGRITSDAGGLLLRELDQRYRFTEYAARCLHDPRDSRKVKHDLLTLGRQRRFGMAQGCEDNNDAATLAKDPAFKIMAGKAPESAPDLATAQVNTLRLKLVKIGALIRETGRHIWVHLASGYPYRNLLAGLL
jgi:hypothetical protein